MFNLQLLALTRSSLKSLFRTLGFFVLLCFALLGPLEASAQATFSNLLVSPTSGTVDSSGKLPVTASGSTSSSTSSDSVYEIDLMEGSTVLISQTYPVSYNTRTGFPVNTARSISLTAGLSPGTHTVFLRSYLADSGLTADSQSFFVTVSSAAQTNAAAFVSQSVPSSMVAGQRYNVSVTMRNNGTATWAPGGANPYRLGATNPDNNNTWGLNRVELGADAVIRNGDSYTFNFTVTAPSTANTYNFQWGMLQEYVEWFGNAPNVAVNVVNEQPTATFTDPPNGATFYADSTGQARVTFWGAASPGTGLSLANVQLLENGNEFSATRNSTIFGSKQLTTGTHTIELRVTNSANQVTSALLTVTVAAQQPAVPPAPTASISSPSSGATIATSSSTASVALNASGTPAPGATISQLRVYVDGALNTSVNAATLNVTLSLAAGFHTIEIEPVDNFNSVGARSSISISITTGGPQGPPTINVSPKILNLTVGGTEPVTWTSTNATAVTRSCTASGSGYVGTVNLGLAGTRNESGSSAWVGSPSTCTWTATGPGGTATFVQTVVTRSMGFDFMGSDCSQTGPESGQVYTAGITPNYYVRGNNVDGYLGSSDIPTALVHSGLLAAGKSARVIIIPLGVVPIIGTTANGVTSLNYGLSPTACGMRLAVEPVLTVTPSSFLNLVVGQATTVSWSAPNAAFVTRTCTSSGTGYYGTITLPPSGSRTETGNTAWLGFPSSCTWTAWGVNSAQGYAKVTQTMATSTSATTAYCFGRMQENLTWTASTTSPWVYGNNSSGYSADSNVSSALVHSGLLKSGQTANVRLQPLGMVPYFSGTTANGFTSLNYSSADCGMKLSLLPGVPSVSITVPQDSSTFVAKGTTFPVIVQGAATPPADGSTISKIELLDNGTVIDTALGVTAYNKAITLDPFAHSLSLVATTNAGVRGNSATVRVNILTSKVGDSAQFVSQDAPTSMRTGQPYTVTVSMVNDGSTTWTDADGYRLGAQNPQDNRTFGGRAYLSRNIAPGETAVFTFQVAAPPQPGTYNFQWQMLRENVAWFGTTSTNVPIKVTTGTGPTATISASPTNVRVGNAQTQNVQFAATGISSSGTVSKLELFQDSGRGYGIYPISTASGGTSSFTYPFSLNLTAGVYAFKVRATDSAGVQTDSTPVMVNITSSSLLGTVSGVRTNAAGNPELFGWVCQPGNANGLTYQVLLDAPTPDAGGVLLTSGMANVNTELDTASVQSQCSTPDAGHHFVVDLSAYVSTRAGHALYVYAKTADAATTVTLPCADNNCTMPGTMRVGLTTPLNGDKYQLPNPAFLRMQLTNASGTFDEIGFVVDGQWVAASYDGTPGTYSASLYTLPARSTPYIVYAKVRQGNTTIQSVANQFFMVAATPTTVSVASPADGATVGLSSQTLTATVSGPATSVKFFVNGTQLSGSASGSGTSWSQTWTPSIAGSYSLYARAYDVNVTQVAQSSTVSVTVSAAGSSATPVPIAIDVPQLANGIAGTLPGSLSVTSSGAAAYSIPIAVPLGTSGMRPTLSLDYSSDNTTGSAGLGWSVGGLSNIDRCGKIAAIDGVTSTVKFTNEDRLCLDGQRLILESGSNDDASYWANGVVYRTEIESFTRVTALGAGVANRAFKVETKDGLWRWYGWDVNAASVVKDLRTDSSATGLAHRWRLDRGQDRVGNFIAYGYQNFPNGENKPLTISWGGNGAAAYANVTFGYQTRSDNRRAYVGGSPTFEAQILKTITTSTVDDGGAAIQALTYTLAHKPSPTSGRNLLSQVQLCGADGTCLPSTNFQWGEPDSGATKSFVQLGADREGPNLEVLGSIFTSNTKYSPMEMILVGDFNGDGRADILERRGDKRLFLSNVDGTGWTETHPLSVANSIEVMEIGDFNGDGKTDFLIADAASAPATNWQVCLYENATYNCRAVELNAAGINAYDRIHSRLVRDFDGDGRDDVYISSGAYLGIGTMPPRYLCIGYSTSTAKGFDCQPTTRDMLNEDTYGDAYTLAGHDSADFDGDGHVDSAELTRCKWLRNPDTGKYSWDCGNYTGVNVIGYPSMSGAPFVGGWYQLSTTSPEGVIPQVRSGTLSADLSADGLTDIVFGTSSLNSVTESLGTTRASNLCTSRGDGKADCAVLPPLGTGLDHLILTLQDFDGDGVQDILRPGVDTWTVDSFNAYVLCRIGTNGSFQSCEPWSGPTFYSLNRRSAMRDSSLENSWTSRHSQFLGDFDGDGRVDIATYLTGGKWQIFRAATQAKTGQYLDKIVSVTNGRGNVESVQFASPADATVYLGDGTAIDGQPLVTGWPIKRVANTRALVSRLERSNGASGSRVTTYEYSGYAVDALGRGNLGFARVKEHDSISNVDTSIWYSQQFPSVGMMTDRLAMHGTVELERTHATVQAFDRAAKPASVAKIVPYVASSVTTKKDLDGTPMGVTTTTYGYDDWVNPDAVTEETVLGPSIYKSVTSTSFTNDASRWLLAKPATVSVTKTTDQGPITRTTTYGYDSDTGLLTSETREPGNQNLGVITTYDRATSGTPSNPFGLVNKTTVDWYDAASGTKKTRVVSQVYYDAYGRYPRQVLNALGQVESQSYDPRSGAKTSVTAINGLTTSFTVDGFGRTIGEIHPDKIEASTVERKCDGTCVAGATTLVIKRTLSGSALTSAPILSHVDSAGHVLRVQTWGFNGTKIFSDVGYDGAGREWKVYHPRFDGSDPQLAKQTGYDDLGRPSTVQKPDELGQTHVWTTQYAGWTTTFSQPAPKGVNVSSLSRTEARDVWGRLAKATDTKGNSTTYEHDAFGNLTKVTDAKGNVVTVTFDTLGRRTDLRDPDLGWIHYDVDALGRVYRQISPNQRIGYPAGTQPPDDKVTMFTYDDLGRMTQRREPDLVSNWIFDNGTNCSPTSSQSCGQLIEANTMAGSVKDYRRTHTYDTAGRPKTTTTSLDTDYTSTTEYDTWGRMLRQRHQRTGGAEKVFDYRYNSFGYLARIERSGLVLWRATALDAANRLKNAELGNNTKVERGYSDYAGQVTSSTLANGAGTQLLNESYQYDALSNVSQRDVYWDLAPAHFTEAFDYDELNRLRMSTLGSNVSTFTYNEIGNMLSKTGVGDYVYPGSGAGSVRPHAVSSIPGSSFDYDDNGNLKSGAGRTVTWTSFDMPRKITKGIESSTFWYGPDHQRVRQARNTDTCGVTSCVYYAGAIEVEVTNGAATVKTYWPSGLGVEIDDASGTQLRWTHLDRQGSVVAISDEAGAVRERLIYDSWGKRRNLADTATPDNVDGVTDNKGYTGHEMLDKLDLVHMNGRVYDPLVARFMSADPIIQDPEHSQSYNRYTYVWNNPTNLTDPTGFFGEGETRPERTVIPCEQDSRCPKEKTNGSNSENNENKNNSSTDNSTKTPAGANAASSRKPENHIGDHYAEYLRSGAAQGDSVGTIAAGYDDWALGKGYMTQDQWSERAGARGLPAAPVGVAVAVATGAGIVAETLSSGAGLLASIKKFFGMQRALSKSEAKAIRSLQEHIAEHEKKIIDFKNNPTVRPGMENLPKAKIEAQQARRIEHLQQEIDAALKNIQDILDGTSRAGK